MTAIDLREGDAIETMDGCAYITKIEKTRHEEPIPVYNFHVKEWASYFVGEVRVYVHNGKGHKTYTVDPAMQAKDIEEKVLVDGSYIKNPTAQNMSDLIKPGSNYVGNSKMNGQFMYVVDTNGNIVIGTRAGQHMPHPILIGGVNPTVRGAGIVEIRGGKIYSIDNASGHFKPDNSCLTNVQNAYE